MNPVLRTIRVYSARHVKYSTLPSEAVIFMGNDMVACWHPDKPFPYECSLPLPEEKHEDNSSVLKVGEKDIAEIFKKKKDFMVIDELTKLTYTTKHRWFPRSRDKKPKDLLPDRPYL
ncbi:PREDICTED: 39S ribosomal protein L42, mitochondrial [Dinoponera quadriceps]|uniref:Large ribosomal subunit protein mL42 n=1 Tax=Dinoponera quadriceps TaxID=609295 RepID=A0A6P3X3Y7_DINQU|nr:PREDICTED: 39S ribosomal protein L42, mitochondrial [Dinoponera quadriceps]XP_014472998.1 PREDICTED: 39S ribosomal protein L42, mitochondrial [Dinoponera quadriceps]